MIRPTILLLAAGLSLVWTAGLLAAEPAAAPAPATAEKVDPDMPKAEKDNTFAQDTYMRRHKYPLQIKVTAAYARGAENLPITLSVACGEGDYPKGKLCPLLDSKPVPAQVDVLTTWPSDGSIKHALVSLVLPPIGRNESKTYTFAARAPEMPGGFVLDKDVDVRKTIFRTSFDNPDGKKTVTEIDAATASRIADVLAGKVSGEEAKKLAPRMCGPVCYEFEVKVPATTGGASDKDIDVFYRLRLYSGVKGVRVEYDVENTRIPAKPYPNSFTVTDRDFEKIVFQAGPADKPETVYEQGAVTHWFATRYRICRWWGAKPLETYARESVPYLIYSEFFPKFDFEHPLTDAELATQIANMKKKPWNQDKPWYREPAEFPDGQPLFHGPLESFMGHVGGRAEIGFYPEWVGKALASDSPMMAHNARLYEGNALAAFPIHVRPPENGQPGSSGLKNPMQVWIYAMGNFGGIVKHVRGGSGKGCPNSSDTGHVPSAAYYTYLATGERFYEDEMSFWAAALPPGCPAAGKTDTFAQDTWLRRNKYPLSIKVTEAYATGGQYVPTTLSVACGEGDYPVGKLCPMLDGKPVPAQVDVLATWPGDGSIKHALVSLVLPMIGFNESVTYTFSAAAPPAPDKFVPAIDLNAFVFRTEFANPDGRKTVTAIDPATLAKIADVLAGKITGEEAKKLAPRLCGPVCYEFEVKVPAKTGDEADKDIDVYYLLRVYTGMKQVRVEYDVENTRIPAVPVFNSFTATDRDFEKLVFQAGPADKPETVYEQGAVTHWFATRYRVCRWWGNRVREILAKENTAYLVYSEFFPKIDLEHPLTVQEFADTADRFTAAKWFKNSTDFPDGEPLSNGPVRATMGNVGGRAEIGFYPEWTLLALASDSRLMAHNARLWEGNALGAFPAHVRPADNGQPGASGNNPMRQALYDGKYHHVGSGKGKGCPNSTDIGHVPSVAYYTYLATGERFYEDEMAFWAAAMLPSDNVLRRHDRYTAWPVRNATDAAFILPDGHPLKKYFAQQVQACIDHQAKAVKDPAAYWKGQRTGGQRGSWVCANYSSPWNECFMICVMDNASRKGFPAAAAVREAEAEMLYRLFGGQEEFKAPNGKVYRWSNPACMIPYSIAVETLRLDCTDPKHIKGTVIKSIVDNTGAMYYYTMLNEQHQYAVDETDSVAFAAKLPKKVMEPEDWVLDPEFEKKFGERQSGYMTFVDGLPPAIAALARYDNPRAQKLYEFDRSLMEKMPRCKRVLGTEAIK